jgi:Holliday junction DNA helicase RuvB
VGIEAVAASLSEERGTLEEVVEPFLLQVGLIARTPRGRVATAAGFQHMGLEAPSKAPTGGLGSTQGRLF